MAHHHVTFGRFIWPEAFRDAKGTFQGWSLHQQGGLILSQNGRVDIDIANKTTWTLQKQAFLTKSLYGFQQIQYPSIQTFLSHIIICSVFNWQLGLIPLLVAITPSQTRWHWWVPRIGIIFFTVKSLTPPPTVILEFSIFPAHPTWCLKNITRFFAPLNSPRLERHDFALEESPKNPMWKYSTFAGNPH